MKKEKTARKITCVYPEYANKEERKKSEQELGKRLYEMFSKN